MNQLLKVKLLDKNAQIPQKGSALSAGYDLFANSCCLIPSMGKALIKTGIAISIPYSHYARIAPRSGLAHKHFIGVGAGVIDEDYRGEVGVILFNHSGQAFQVNKGDRIAQLILEKITYAQVMLVDELDDTQRGEGGFGSTGVTNPILHHTNLNAFSQDQRVSQKLDGMVKDAQITQQEAQTYNDTIQKIVKQNHNIQHFINSHTNSLELLKKIDIQ